MELKMNGNQTHFAGRSHVRQLIRSKFSANIRSIFSSRFDRRNRLKLADKHQLRHAISAGFIGFIFLSLLSLAYLNLYISSASGIQPGDSFPELRGQTCDGLTRLSYSDSMATLVTLFHPDCDHCSNQLDLLNLRKSLLKDVNLIFLTHDENFVLSGVGRQWPELSGCRWAKVNADSLNHHFGCNPLPTTFVFNREGSLLKKITGEVSFAKIMSSLALP